MLDLVSPGYFCFIVMVTVNSGLIGTLICIRVLKLTTFALIFCMNF